MANLGTNMLFIVQTYHVYVFYADTTKQYYYASSLKDTAPAAHSNLRIHYTVRARNEHDAIARCLLEAYMTKDVIHS